jgi:hypothetical protein
MSRRGFLASVVLGVAVTAGPGCTPPPEQPTPPPQDQKLAPGRAKEALLEMMRSKPGQDLGWFDGDVPDKMSKMAVEEQEDGWYSWGAFRFHPAQAIYTFVVQPAPGVRACAFAYRGSFESQEGRWVATPPQLVSTALQAGE